MSNPVASRSQELIQMEEKWGAHNYHPLDIVIEKAEGVWVTDVDGNRFMDCLSAYSAVNQGHCNPKILETFLDQAKRVTLTSRAFRNEQLPLLYETLFKMTGMESVLMMNSGAEAVETAIKMARKWGYKKKGIPDNQAEIIVCDGNFHGRTTTIVGFSSEEQYKDGFGPFTPGFKMIPYGDADALEAAITDNTCAFLVEPIQGEAGINIPQDGFLKRVREICDKHNVLFMADEIQCGLGRAGKMFAFEHEGVTPDAIIIGKALSGGFYPVSAVLSKWEYMDVFEPGDHGSTFGGNPLGCAVARTALQVIQDDNLIQKSQERGAYLMDKLRTLKNPHIKEVRGRGLMIGIEFDRKVRDYCEQLKAEGVLCKETHDTVIRITPPLVISQEELDWAFERIQKIVDAGV